MNTMMIVGMMALALTSARAQSEKLTICTEPGNDKQPVRLVKAQAMASKMFDRAGVKIDWRRTGRSCPEGAIIINRRYHTPAGLKPGALAYARLFQGTKIELFMDRIEKDFENRLIPVLLAHVMVHEVTHVLQSVDRHSTTGVMKARWSREDFLEMAWKPLPFTERDVQLIRIGLGSRATRFAAANRAGN